MAIDVSGRIGDSNGPTWRLVVPDGSDSIGTLTISPGTADLTWNQVNGPWANYLKQINIINITGAIQVAGSINGLFANLTRASTFTGLYRLNMIKNSTIVTMDNLFLNTPAIIGYGMLGTAFWTVQAEHEAGFLEIGAGAFEWKGLRTVPIGVQGATEEVPTSPWDDYRIHILEIKIMGNLTISNSARNLFYFLNRVTKITGLTKVDITAVSDIGGLFRNMWSLNAVDLSSFNTSAVTDMSWLFSNTWNLTKITFPDPLLSIGLWLTSNVTTMEGMFFNAKSLQILDVSNWDTSKVTKMNSMFYCASKLTYLDVANWDTDLVTDMSFMFFQCGVRRPLPALYDLDVANWQIGLAQVTWMFYRDKPRENPVTPYDPEDPSTHQWEPDPIRVDISLWEVQWKEMEELGLYTCRANMLGLDKPLWPPGLIYPDCADYAEIDCAQFYPAN